MNPKIDLRSFQSGNQPSVSVSGRHLVSPPRRIFTRFALPIALFTAFASMVAYATRDALIPVVEVEVVQPVIAAGGLATTESTAASQPANEESPVDTSGSTAPANPASSDNPPNTDGARPTGQPLFQAPGWVEPDPFTTLVSSLIPGTISQVYVREGETVAAGHVVAELDSTDAKIALQKAEAILAVRQAELDAAQQNWEHPIVIKQTLETAQAEKGRLEAEKIKLQRQFEFQTKLAAISRQLGKSGADSVLTAERAALEANVAEATVREIEAKIVAQQATIRGAASTAELRIEDKSKLSLAKAQMQEAIAALDEAKVAVQRCQVTAPTTGTVMRLHKTPGAMVSSDVPEGTQIISMYDPQSLQVRAEVPLAEAAKIQIGLPADIRVEAMPDRVFIGELTRVVHEADVQRNSLQVKVRILDPSTTLKPEMVARVQFKAASPKVEIKPENSDQKPGESSPSVSNEEQESQLLQETGLLIPASLIPKGSKDEVELWLVGADMRASRKKVKLGPGGHEELREVTAGLQPSDKIIASNTDKLSEGSRIKIAAGSKKGN